ncbi:hypothetical protein BA93_03250 [Finegoldia magna ALB8]|uniref:hypothetical protein n=1 Tax=Finegoldia magna TaxID=1260 RepID=UPI00044CC9C9|nr:hypothetical protein [Finegoldia magna]EXF27689.1 hypothetical protein BA93_03250 [Finegoldia magna ALB8]
MNLNDRIKELNSCILKVEQNGIKILGFLSKERLLDYYNKHTKCQFSQGFYEHQDYNLSYAPSNGLIIEIKDGKTNKISFEDILIETISYTKENNKKTTKTFKIRVEQYTNKYNYVDVDSTVLFDTKLELEQYIQNKFNIDWKLKTN